MSCYGLHRSEADQIFELLNMAITFEEEWQQMEESFLTLDPSGLGQVGFYTANRKGDTTLDGTYAINRVVHDLDSAGRLQVLMGKYGFHMIKGDLLGAESVAEEVVALATAVGDLTALLDSCASLGMVLFHVGKLAKTRLYLEKGMDIYERNTEGLNNSMVLISRPEILCLAHLSHTLWFLGYPEQGMHKTREALRLARQTDISNIGCGLFYASAFHQLLRDTQSTIEYAQSAMSLTSQIGDTHWIEKSRIMMGWAMSQQGETEAGINAILQGLEGLSENPLDAGLAHSRYLTMLAEAYIAADQIDKAVESVGRAWPRLEANGEFLWEPDLCMVEGEILRATGDQEGATQKFQRALLVARNQGARIMELRAVTRLAGQLNWSGQREQARISLTEAYNWFTEGYDTNDLKDARSLLKSLDNRN